MATHSNRKSNTKLKNILWIGLLTGTLDAIAALIWASPKTQPVVVFKYIASGAFGKAAFAGGPHFTNMVLWGVLFHFVIAYSLTAVFYINYPGFAPYSKTNLCWHWYLPLLPGLLPIWLLFR